MHMFPRHAHTHTYTQKHITNRATCMSSCSFGLGPLDVPGGRVMADTTSVWIIELLELWQHTGNAELLQELYHAAVGGVKWQIAASEQLGLPYGLVCTYDILNLQQYPTTTCVVAFRLPSGWLEAFFGLNCVASI